TELASDDRRRQLAGEWFMKAGFTGKSLQKNDDFLAGVIAGKIRVIPHGVARLEGSTVHFTNGEHVDADVIMCCTGYEESSIPAKWLGGAPFPPRGPLVTHAVPP